ncbi:serine/threonine protein kinase [Naegleria gruberi]|uniref:Serine/threonine protein kinase n=1 Tax=Naegleria gruberi TaxID=5762 RepID=D2V832_NAEGR|nr:serine/threonine protein kinase [Naegleria gruberi]EFC46973.1 serine/threonine protein kinase [Naegleria gruberi]|eukprot:XP_002679717.1 serine/threonine protein kinase [Naegleria gruberi strain NEG-M]
MQPSEGTGDIALVEREEEIFTAMKNVQCEYIAKSMEFLNYFESDGSGGYIGIVMPFYKFGDLETFIERYFTSRGKRLTDFLIGQIMTQLCIAVNLSHKHNLVHCDIKLSNILVKSFDEENETFIEIALADFGETFRTDHTTNTDKKGTDDYLPPEAFDGKYGFKIDCCSMGVVLFKLLCPPTDVSIRNYLGECQTKYKHKQRNIFFSHYWSKKLAKYMSGIEYLKDQPLLLSMVNGFLTYDKESRLTILNALDLCCMIIMMHIHGQNNSVNLDNLENPSPVLILYDQLSLISDFNNGSMELLSKYYNETKQGNSLGIAYMVGLIFCSSLLKRDFRIWEFQFNLQTPITDTATLDKMIQDLDQLSLKIKTNEPYLGFIFEQLHAISLMNKKMPEKSLQRLENSTNSFFTLACQKKKLLLVELLNGMTYSLVDEYSKLIKLYGDKSMLSGYFYYKRGVMLFTLSNDHQNGIADLIHARNLSPNSLGLYAIMVNCFLTIGSIENAKQVFEQMLLLSEHFEINRLNFIAMFLSNCLGYLDKALEYGEKLTSQELYSKDPVLLLFLSRICSNRGDSSMELGYIETALDIDPHCYQAHQMKILFYRAALDFTAEKEALLKYTALKRQNLLHTSEFPIELLPLLPDGSPLPILLLNEPEKDVTRIKEITFKEAEKTVQQFETIQPSLMQEPTTNDSILSPEIIMQIKVKFKGKNNAVFIDILKTDTDIRQVLDRLNKIGNEKSTAYVNRVAFSIVKDDDCILITSIHQLSKYDEVVALTSDEEKEFWA